MEIAKKEESQYVRSLIEASLDPLVTISAAGKITDINDASVRVTGISREELIGTDFSGYFTEPQKARDVYKEVFAKRSVADSPLTLRHKDGKLTDVLFNGSVYTDGRDNVVGVVIVARDVTDQKRIATELLEAKKTAERAAIISPRATIISEKNPKKNKKKKKKNKKKKKKQKKKKKKTNANKKKRKKKKTTFFIKYEPRNPYAD